MSASLPNPLVGQEDVLYPGRDEQRAGTPDPATSLESSHPLIPLSPPVRLVSVFFSGLAGPSRAFIRAIFPRVSLVRLFLGRSPLPPPSFRRLLPPCLRVRLHRTP